MRFEPTTSVIPVHRSSQLSYEAHCMVAYFCMFKIKDCSLASDVDCSELHVVLEAV